MTSIDVPVEVIDRKIKAGVPWNTLVLKGLQYYEGGTEKAIKNQEEDINRLLEKIRTLAMRVQSLEADK